MLIQACIIMCMLLKRRLLSFLFIFRISAHDLCVCKIFVAGPLSAPMIPLPGLSRVINSLLTYFIYNLQQIISEINAMYW